jgi:hypothetical protein
MGQTAPEYFKPYLYDTGTYDPTRFKNSSILYSFSDRLILVRLAAGTAVYLSTPRASFLDGRFVFSNYDMEQLEELKEKIVEEDLLKTKVTFGDCLGSTVIPPK